MLITFLFDWRRLRYSLGKQILEIFFGWVCSVLFTKAAHMRGFCVYAVLPAGYLTPGKPTVFPVLPPRENESFPDPFPVRFLHKGKEAVFMSSRQESNLHYRLRKPAFYPLNYGRCRFKCTNKKLFSQTNRKSIVQNKKAASEEAAVCAARSCGDRRL